MYRFVKFQSFSVDKSRQRLVYHQAAEYYIHAYGVMRYKKRLLPWQTKDVSCMEQGTGVEPAAEAWEASVLPIY